MDGTGNVLVAGSFKGIVSWGNAYAQSVLSSIDPSYSDAFLAKYDSAGRIIWVSSFGTGSSETSQAAVAIAGDGSAYVAASQAYPNLVVCKYAESGGLVWSKFVQSSQPTAICVDPSNSVYVTGYYHGTATFSGTNLVSSRGSRDIFVAKYDDSGNLQWVIGAGGPGDDYAYGIAATSSGDLYLTGGFEATVVFGAFSLKSGADEDLFLAKLRAGGGDPQPNLGLRMYPGLSINGLAGRLYEIQSTDAVQTDWQSLTNLVLPYSLYLWVDISSRSGLRRFYRAVLVQP